MKCLDIKYKLILFITLCLQVNNIMSVSFFDAILLRIMPSALLFQAVESGNVDLMRKCIERTDLNSLDYKGLAPLHYAFLNKDSDTIKFLIAEGANINVKDKSECTVLHYAIKMGDIGVIGFLVEQGANINIHNEEGYTPLHYAAEQDNPNIVTLLIKHGANVCSMTPSGTTPYMRAYNHGHKEICHILESNGGYTVLEAVRYGDIETVRNLLSNVNDIAIPNGRTLLHVAVAAGHIPIMELLLKHGANINAGYKDQWTPLHVAILVSKKIDVLAWLIKNGADINAKYKNGWTLLHCAMLIPRLDIVRLLISSGVPNIQDKDGATALDFITSLGITAVGEYEQVVEYLRSIDAH